MPTAVEQEGVKIRFYSIDSQLLPIAPDSLGDDETLLYPNYFGIAGRAEKIVVDRFGRDRIILDRSQALFAIDHAGIAEIHSPRKFVGMPDGGLLRSDIEVTLPTNRQEAAPETTQHLTGRIESGSRNWLDHFRKNESLLGDSEPARISRTAEHLLTTANLEWTRQTRTDNFSLLHNALATANRLSDLLQDIPDGPLCYPFLPGKNKKLSHAALAEAGVYCARYWPEVIHRPGITRFEREMAERCLALPLDQRYSASEMAHVIKTVLELLK